jgi:hypothetical protein
MPTFTSRQEIGNKSNYNNYLQTFMVTLRVPRLRRIFS